MMSKVHEEFTKLMMKFFLVGDSSPACLLDISQQQVPPVVVGGELENISEIKLNQNIAS